MKNHTLYIYDKNIYDKKTFHKNATFIITKEDKTDCLILFEKIKEKFNLDPDQYLGTFTTMAHDSNTIKVTSLKEPDMERSQKQIKI